MPGIIIKAPNGVPDDVEVCPTETGTLWLEQGSDYILLSTEQVAQLTQALITLKNTGKLP